MIEIMIVVSILTLLASLTVSNFLDYTAKARKQGAQAYLASYYSSTKNATMYLGCNPGNFVAVGFNPTGIIRSRILTADGGCDDLPVGFPESKDCVSTAYDKNHSGSECVVGDSYKPLFEEEASLENVGDRRCPAIDGQSISPDNKGKDYFFKALACSDYDDDPLLMCVCHNGVIGVGKQCSFDECKDCATENCASYECSTNADCTDTNKPECNSKTRTCQKRSCNPDCIAGQTCNNGSCESVCDEDSNLPHYNPDDGTCVQCTKDAHCTVEGESCLDDNKCGVPPQCTQHDLDNCIYCIGGRSQQQCNSSQHCAGKSSDDTRSVCHACISDSECGCGKKCDTTQSINKCVETLSCNDPSRPLCNNINGQDRCVECIGGENSKNCSGAKPHCDGFRCVECLNDRHCEKIYSDKTTCGGDGVCYDQGEQGP